MVTEDEGPFISVEQTAEDQTQFVITEREESPSNALLADLKTMHFICFVLLFIANVFPSGMGNRVLLNWRLLKALMSFVTIPYYIYQICYAFNTVDEQYISFSEETTPENYTVEETMFLPQKYGNAILWLKVEIFAFYCNLFVCFLYLAKARCTTTEDTSAEDYGFMVVCQDYATAEEHEAATNVHIFDVEGKAGRDRLRRHLKMEHDTDFTINMTGTKRADKDQ